LSYEKNSNRTRTKRKGYQENWEAYWYEF
jgi:hypothetical protein